MPKPKFKISKDRILAIRKFTDRVEFIEAYFNKLNNVFENEYNILTYYGVGGVGKTRLKNELTERTKKQFQTSDLRFATSNIK